MIQIISKRVINEYYQKGYSLIPLKNNSKIPAIRWKPYQYKRASFKDILSFYVRFNEPNIAIITGRISKLLVLDVDDPLKLPELFKLLPEAERTTRVKTKRCYHFYFSHNGNEIKSTKNFLKLGIELQANGCYVVACPSVINDFTYTFEIPLSKMLSFPIIEKKESNFSKDEVPLSEIQPLPRTGIKEGKQAPGIEYKKRNFLSLPRYNGLDLYCLKQILGRNLPIGERDNSLFILYGLLCQNKNRSDHAKKIVTIKNNSLSKPLTDTEIKKVFRKRYNLKCFTVRETLPFIECDKCKFRFKGGKLGMGNIIVKNLRNLEKLDPSEQRVLLFLGTVFEGEKPSLTALSKKMGMHFDTVKGAVKRLKEKGIIE